MNLRPLERYEPVPANDAGTAAEDVRDRLRRDHQAALADLASLQGERDERRAASRLQALRQAWIVHALAEETVVYRALEGVAAARADERFIEHELVGALFEKIAAAPFGTLEWQARLKVIGDLMSRHMETEHQELFSQLAARFDPAQLRELGERFDSARDKLMMLEQAKAA